MANDKQETKRLIDLAPEYRELSGIGRCLLFECPVAGHMIAIPCDRNPWPHTGARWTITNGDDFTKLSISPSIDEHDCWHGWVTNGEVR
jgi:hypothetical protein